MNAVWALAKGQLRQRVRVAVLLALLVGLGAGAVLTALAGARRTDAALPRFLVNSHATDTDAAVYFPPQPGDDLTGELRTISALPEVDQAFRGAVVALSGADPSVTSGRRTQIGLLAMDPGAGRLFGRPVVVAGRLPHEDVAEEVAIDEELTARRHLGVGSVYHARVYTAAQADAAAEDLSLPPRGAIVDLRVVGIVRLPQDLLPAGEQNPLVPSDELHLTPAFWQRHGLDVARLGTFIGVELRRGKTDVRQLAAHVGRAYGDQALVIADRTQPLAPDETVIAGLQQAMRVESRALLVFATLAALAALLLVGQTLGRQISLDSIEYPTLRALGMTRSQLIGIALVQAASIGAGGAAVAMAVATALSPLTPVGIARRAELSPGVSINLAVLAVGAAVTVALVLVCAALAAWQAARRQEPSLAAARIAGVGQRPSRLTRAVAAIGLRPTIVTGMRLALEPGRGRTAVPVRTATAGAAAAVCALLMVSTFAASLTRLTTSAVGYGVTWDVSVGNFSSAQAAQRGAGRLDDNPAVAAYAGLGVTDLAIDGRQVTTLLVEPSKAAISPRVVDGRPPTGPDEIALGAITMRTLGKHIGDTVQPRGITQAQPHPPRLRIVGSVVLNAAGADGAGLGHVAPGKGAVTTFDALRRIVQPNEAAQHYATVFLVRLDPAADRAAALRRLERDFPGTVIRTVPPTDLRNIQRVSGLPGLLGALVALLALGTLTHTLVSSIRRRRRDLAILKALGYVRAQVAATLAWQATTVATMAVLVGLPIGLAGGRWAWRLVAGALGVAQAPVTPLLAALAVVTGTLAVANLVAAIPGWVAGRIPPAVVLRTE
jgi:FtsX-like permease family